MKKTVAGSGFSIRDILKASSACIAGIVLSLLINTANADTVSLMLRTDNSTQLGSGSISVSHDDADPRFPSAEGYDLLDKLWSAAPGNPIDQWLKPYTKPYGQELTVDVRPSGSLTPAEVSFSLVTKDGNPGEFNNMPVYCEVAFNFDTGNFTGKTLVFQQESLSAEGEDIYPVFDLRRIMDGKLPLFDAAGNPLVLNETYNNGDILAKGTLYFDRLLSDLNDDGDVGASDLALMAGQWLNDGYARAGDITGASGKPDGKVDLQDLAALASEWIKSTL